MKLIPQKLLEGTKYLCVYLREGHVSSLEKEVQDHKDSISQLQLERTELIAKVLLAVAREWL